MVLYGRVEVPNAPYKLALDEVEILKPAPNALLSGADDVAAPGFCVMELTELEGAESALDAVADVETELDIPPED